MNICSTEKIEIQIQIATPLVLQTSFYSFDTVMIPGSNHVLIKDSFISRGSGSKCSEFGENSAFNKVSDHFAGFPSSRIFGTVCTWASYILPPFSSFKISDLSNWLFSNTHPLYFLSYAFSLCFSVHPQPSLSFILSETISGFSNWLPSTAAITVMGRSVEGEQRGGGEREKKDGWKEEMKSKRGLFWIEVLVTSVDICICISLCPMLK